MPATITDPKLVSIFAGIAHEVRNPLQGIIASVAALHSKLENDQSMKPFLEMINYETSRISQLLDSMMEMSHPIRRDSQPMKLDRVLEEAIRALIFKGVHPSIRKDQIPKSVPIFADSNRISRAMNAILQNSVDAGARNIVIQAGIETGQLLLKMEDDGEGISTEDLPLVLDPFFTRRKKRPGLGLAVAAHIVTSHDGNITVESQKGYGTLVSVTLPLSQ